MRWRLSPEHSDRPASPVREPEAPVFAAPGTLEEETIDEEEADTVRYEEASDEGYEEFEEETRAAGQQGSQSSRDVAEVRETVTEIHMSSLAEAGVAPAAEGAAAEGEEDSEELELEEAQAEAEALLDAEARGAGTVDARAEVRAPAATAGYTQRAPRPRPGFDRPARRTPWRWPPLSAPRIAGSSEDQRLAQGRPGDPGADCQGADRQERRAHHQPHRAAGALPGLHADGEPYRSFAQDRVRGRTAAAEAHHDERARERTRRLHRSHRGAERQRRRTARRHSLPERPVERNQDACGGFEAAGADLSRSQRCGARAARPGDLRLFRDLGRYRAGIRAHSALLQPLPARLWSSA